MKKLVIAALLSVFAVPAMEASALGMRGAGGPLAALRGGGPAAGQGGPRARLAAIRQRIQERKAARAAAQQEAAIAAPAAIEAPAIEAPVL